jgi:hypothetical protein
MNLIDTLIQDLQHRNRYIRSEASNALRQIGSAAVRSLLPLLHAPDPQVRIMVIATLTAIPDPDAVAAFIALLEQHTQRHGWLEERVTIAEALSRIDLPQAQETAFAFFADRLRHGTWSERQQALSYVINFPYPEAEALVRQALNDQDPDVRKAAANCLLYKENGISPRVSPGEIPLPTFAQPNPDSPPIDHLLERLKDSPDENIIKALGESGDSRAVDALLDALAQSESGATAHHTFSMRLKIVSALARLGDPHALPTLRSLVHTDMQAVDAWGMGVAFSIAEVAQESIEKIEWRMHKLGVAIPEPEAADDASSVDVSSEQLDQSLAFPALLKLAPNHPAIQTTFQRFDEPPHITEDQSSDRRSYNFQAHGISFAFKHDQLATIYIYVRPAWGYAAWTYTLPHKLHQAMNRIEVRRILGHPEAGSNIYEGPDGWDRWIFADHGFHIRYTENGSTLSQITIIDMDTFL